MAKLIRHYSLDRPGLEFLGHCHGDGLGAPPGFTSVVGCLLPMRHAADPRCDICVISPTFRGQRAHVGWQRAVVLQLEEEVVAGLSSHYNIEDQTRGLNMTWMVR